jgi:acetyl-CoA carboxylase biotin carboxylase subunit
MFRKILIANRGEIAVRVIRACREMGIGTVAVYSDADRTALHVRMADEAVAIGAAAPGESYLNIDRILDAARRTGAEAIHPGYGFLSENARFPRACAAAGVKFIGPPASAMELMGSKTRARQAMQAAGVPVVPGTTEAVSSDAEALAVAAETGYPVMLKAAAGGGGKGMRLVHSPGELGAALTQARAEAQGAFGDSAVYIEKAIVRPRHIEVQVLADEHGRVIHLGERECTLQRRHQKVLEESPSPFIERHPELREGLCGAAVKAAEAAGYANAGTVEFLMDAEGKFSFLEMNTRLQVEHPVTEMVTGLDLVREQILIAAGEPLCYTQQDISARGHAIECRIYAEDPDNNFFPSPGLIQNLEQPGGPGVRVDSGAYAGWAVPLDYDPLIAKLAVWAGSREAAIGRLRGALGEYHVGGIKTTLGLFRRIVDDLDFQSGEFDTGYLTGLLANGGDEKEAADDETWAALLGAALHFRDERTSQQPAAPSNGNGWRSAGKSAMLR